jgi:hypothetical protein
MKYPSLALVLAVPLAGCGSSSGPSVNEKNATVEQISNKVSAATAAGALRFNPGKWVSTVTVDEMTIPGLPPQAAAMMKKAIGEAHTDDKCLTPEEAKKPQANFFTNKKDCRYDHFTMSGGSIDAKMVCSSGGQSQTFELKGNYSADSYHMAMQGNVTGGPGGREMTMRMHVDAKHVGACTGNEES